MRIAPSALLLNGRPRWGTQRDYEPGDPTGFTHLINVALFIESMRKNMNTHIPSLRAFCFDQSTEICTYSFWSIPPHMCHMRTDIQAQCGQVNADIFINCGQTAGYHRHGYRPAYTTTHPLITRTGYATHGSARTHEHKNSLDEMPKYIDYPENLKKNSPTGLVNEETEVGYANILHIRGLVRIQNIFKAAHVCVIQVTTCFLEWPDCRWTEHSIQDCACNRMLSYACWVNIDVTPRQVSHANGTWKQPLHTTNERQPTTHYWGKGESGCNYAAKCNYDGSEVCSQAGVIVVQKTCHQVFSPEGKNLMVSRGAPWMCKCVSYWVPIAPWKAGNRLTEPADPVRSRGGSQAGPTLVAGTLGPDCPVVEDLVVKICLPRCQNQANRQSNPRECGCCVNCATSGGGRLTVSRREVRQKPCRYFMLSAWIIKKDPCGDYACFSVCGCLNKTSDKNASGTEARTNYLKTSRRFRTKARAGSLGCQGENISSKPETALHLAAGCDVKKNVDTDGH